MRAVLRVILLVTMIVPGSSVLAAGDAIDRAIASEHRDEGERGLDAKRKPDQVLRFFGIEPGMRVFDIFAGGGYYTELMSYIVGPSGSVTHYSNKGWDDYVKKDVAARFANNRLPNVERLVAKPASLKGHKPEFDAAIFVLGMHDIYYADEATGWVAIDKDAFIQGMYDLLVPGGVLGVIDHNAEPGTDPEVVGKSLHRIDPAVIITDLEAVGFVLDSQSYALQNKADDKKTSVFSPENRWNTDRCILKFRKPA